MTDTPATALSFEDAAHEFASIYDEYKRLERRSEVLKARIKATFGSAELRREAKSLYVDFPTLGKSVRITDADPGYALDPATLRTLVNDDDVFLRVITIDKATLDLPSWEAAKAEELVHDDMLLDAVKEIERSPAVAVTKLMRTVVE